MALEERYGTHGSKRWLLPLVAVTGFALAVAWAAWAAQSPKVSAVLWGYKVIDDHHVRVIVDVRRPKPIPVECTVYAQASDHEIVGERTIPVRGRAEKTRVRAVITTDRRAVNGAVRNCRPLP